MRITFHGAAKAVTGSKHHIALDNGFNFLLDCGLFQGMGQQTYTLNRHFGFSPMEIQAVVLSHAHIDHCGLLPRLVKEGFNGKIYCTEATADLLEVMLYDSAHIQETDARFVNKKRSNSKEARVEPLYDDNDVTATLKKLHAVDYDTDIRLNKDVLLSFSNTGHILGSAACNFKIYDNGLHTRLSFTGDIGRYGSPLLQDPHSFPQADIIICESTYGNRIHKRLEEAAQDIMDAMIEICGKRKGKLIIPAFSLGRIQEVVYTINSMDLYGLLPDVPIFVDSPLAIDATAIVEKYTSELNDDVLQFTETGRKAAFRFDDLIYIRDKEMSQQLNDYQGSCVIISSSGMAEAGRVKHHLYHSLANEANGVLMVGYAHPLSLAGKLKSGIEKVRIFGDDIPVNASIYSVDAWSAHADKDEIIEYLSCQDPQQVKKLFLVHGEPEAQQNLRRELMARGYNEIVIPEHGESFYL